MIKVLLVVCNNRMYGTERYVVDLANNLSKDIFEVSVAIPEEGPLSEILKEKGINEIIYHNGKMDVFSFKGSFNLFRLIHKYKFDIIHTNAGIIPNIIGKLLNVKGNIEIKHGILIPDEKLENMSFRKKFHEWIKQFFVDYVIAISENDKQKLIKIFNIREQKIKVIYNGINNKNVLPYQKKIEQDKNNKELIIGSIGRFTYQKGQEYLIDAFTNICKKYNNVKLILVGSGENENVIKNMIINKNVQDYIKIENYKKNIYNFLRKLDVFVLTSRYEGVPYVLLEAMCIGVPIISTRVGGIDNILEDGKDALLIEKGNIKEIEVALEKVIDNAEIRENLSANAIQKVQHYSIDSMVRNTENLYLNLLKIELK